MTAARAASVTRVSAEVNQAVAGYMLGNLLTSLIAGVVVFVTLMIVGVPFPFLWGLWVALVDFLPMIGGALAGIPTVLFAFTQGLTPGIATAIVFIAYTQIENHILNPVIMSKTVKISPLLVLLAVLVGASLGSLVGGLFGGFVAALLAIPVRQAPSRSSSGRPGRPLARPRTLNHPARKMKIRCRRPATSSLFRPVRGSMAVKPPHVAAGKRP